MTADDVAGVYNFLNFWDKSLKDILNVFCQLTAHFQRTEGSTGCHTPPPRMYSNSFFGDFMTPR
jgi:hypothetical protein